MNNTWLIYAGLTVAYIVILVIYFLRRSKSHESELTEFLTSAKQQVAAHKKEATIEANKKVSKAIEIVKNVQQAAEDFEAKAKEEYEQIVKDAKEERREIISSTKAEIEQLFKQAEKELEEYRADRHKEIERNLVKLVMAVSEKVIELNMSPKQHKELILKALEDIKTKKDRA